MARQARQSRPQLVCVLADESASMAGAKAEAATAGVREMIMECQSRGPAGADRSYFEILLISFGTLATVHPACDMRKAREIDPDAILLRGVDGGTNMAAALELVYGRLAPYMAGLRAHPEKDQHPLPIVIIFSDGEHNAGGDPRVPADAIKALKLDGEPVVIAAAGIGLTPGYGDVVLRTLASPGCYVDIQSVQALAAFISSVGSSGASGPKAVAQVVGKLGPP